MISLIGLAAVAIATAQAHAPADHFAYKLKITPSAGPVDPAIDKRYTSQFASCQERAVATYENAECFEAEFIRQDEALNRAWKTAFQRVPAKERVKLRDAQRKWVSKRDPFCNAHADSFNGGTISSIAYSACRVELTIRRTIWLEQLR